MTGLEKAHHQRRVDSTTKRARITQAIELAVARGEIPTVSRIARVAGVDRSMFYGERGQPLRAQLDLAAAQVHADLDNSVNAAARVSAATLRADLATTNELNRRLRHQVTTLERKLSHYMGREIVDQLPSMQRSALLADQGLQASIDSLNVRISELEGINKQLEEDLDGARRAIRDLTRRLNAG